MAKTYQETVDYADRMAKLAARRSVLIESHNTFDKLVDTLEDDLARVRHHRVVVWNMIDDLDNEWEELRRQNNSDNAE